MTAKVAVTVFEPVDYVHVLLLNTLVFVSVTTTLTVMAVPGVLVTAVSVLVTWWASAVAAQRIIDYRVGMAFGNRIRGAA